MIVTTTRAEITRVKRVVESMCDVCHQTFCDGDTVCAFNLDPQLPVVVLARVAWGIWIREITYHSHERCMVPGRLH